jgi:hypothetical protein
VYQITKPTPDVMRVLSIIDRNAGTITKKTLIPELQEVKLMPVYAPSQPRSAPHSRLRALLDPLEGHWQFVSVKSKGRRSEVSLEQQGRDALRIFGPGEWS